MTKQCKQCGRDLSLESFRKNRSKSTGKYNSTTGHWTICKECEALNNKATRCFKDGTEPDFLAKVATLYKALVAKGLEPKGGFAAHVLNRRYEPNRKSDLTHFDYMFDAHCGGAASDANSHLDKLKARGYSDVDEADREHRRLEAVLRENGLYEECADLLDEWFME